MEKLENARDKMKVILSRKGFDSQYGGIPSPIMPDGTLLSMPIPEKSSGVTYKSLFWKKYTYEEILRNLGYSQNIWECHLDPDIYITKHNQLNRKAIFGQCDSAAGHLIKQKVCKGDIFLFFGTFRETEFTQDGRLCFKKGTLEKHIIYGYLQIGDVEKSNFRQYPWHPHSNINKYSNNNRMYLAATNFFNTTHLGYGTFRYTSELVLTKNGESKSKWVLPNILKDKKITYHPNPYREGYFQSTFRGQEFVINIDEDKEVNDVINWVKDKIEV